MKNKKQIKDSKEKLREVKNLIRLMDNKYKVLGIRFGLDPLIGLIPVVGDIIPIAISLYLVRLAVIAQAPHNIILKMILVTTVDFLIGTFPIIGDAADFVYKGHDKNYRILNNYLEKTKDA